MKKYINISGLILRDTNRGTAALGYGSISFLREKGFLKEGQELVQYKVVKKFWKYKDYSETLVVQGLKIKRHIVHINVFEHFLLLKTGFTIPLSKLSRTLKQLDFVAAINGGDGFSDIYNTKTFFSRLPDINIAMAANVPVIILPQTLGPFSDKSNYQIASKILKYAQKVYVRDNKFVNDLNQMGVSYEIAKDLSAYMKPEPWDIEIPPDSIGLNISGLCYSNTFRTLSGQFGMYPDLINRIIKHFQSKGKFVYLIPHSYAYGLIEQSNDDLEACRLAYERLEDKTNVIFVDKDLTSPQVKYVISKMSFFCGTRMHSNFAAIYSGVPLFGLSYSYKFEGAFNANGLDGSKQTSTINNITKSDIESIIEKLERFYQETIKLR